ncbi:protein AGENET DOMAIN (AGD)-CONTAINING P1 isoform X2 [Ziziphus jujuba]|uniref:Protein AGENET DOMAIN (AGD)-CONTAINING P1 isoform X2 n=1 Tax=Ziziphus jujuba TaxID=326968 RepID=A0ABM3I9T2_ZIZJJ|nr:protein AGENET DOMAIN (AGD)-CONTAINING P1 isoform X2 [Ziziphus jujuba]
MPPKPNPKQISNPKTSFFKPGSTVEVSSDEPGFSGSFYLGTIVCPSGSDSFLVQYKTLVTDSSEGSKPLREVVPLPQLRPPPPSTAKWDFRVGDEVEANYNDGWWEGVVTDVLGNGKFSVFFRASEDQIEFSKEDLRLHFKWVNGKWVPPVEDNENEEGKKVPTAKECGKETREEMFSKGTVVEVSSDEDGFRGAWFIATVLEAAGNDKFLVEYQSLTTDDDSEFVKEEIDILHIRPCPPEEIVVDSFNLLDEVDALYNDGWWLGVISKVLSGSRYIVYFRGTEEELEFHHSELRLHQDWIGGKWVMASRAF